jgi:hypothetical protein
VHVEPGYFYHQTIDADRQAALPPRTHTLGLGSHVGSVNGASRSAYARMTAKNDNDADLLPIFSSACLHLRRL